MLEVRDLYAGYYSDLHILQGLNVKAETGKITTILGANGVGKSTLLKAIYGFLKPQRGQILLDGVDVMGTPISGPEANRFGVEFLTLRAVAAPAVFCISASTGILRGLLQWTSLLAAS